ncbi:MAG TPA: CBS domain-containing protein [archaeon]|nr:CBS domain-containing protein [archaeon]
MLVKEIMTRNVISVRPDRPLREAAEIMADNHIGCLVVRTDGKLAGIITDRDILVFIADESHRNLDSYKVKDAMTEYVITIGPDKPVEKAVQIMTGNRIKKIPVLDDDRLAGIITMSDIIWAQPRLMGKLSKVSKKD